MTGVQTCALPISGLVAYAVITLGFEYCIISSFSVGTSLIPDAPGAGLGLMFTFNTIGMAVGSTLGTWLYDNHGPGTATAPVVGSASVAFLLLLTGGVFNDKNAQGHVVPWSATNLTQHATGLAGWDGAIRRRLDDGKGKSD